MDNLKLLITYITNTFLVVASYALDVSSQKSAFSRMENFFSWESLSECFGKGRLCTSNRYANKILHPFNCNQSDKGAMCTGTCLQNEPGYSVRKWEGSSARKLILKLFTYWSWACSWTLLRYRFGLCCLRFDETCCLLNQYLSEQTGQVFGPLFLRNFGNSFLSHNDSVPESKLYQIKMIYWINLNMNRISRIKLYPRCDSANRNF